jgi:hypothetical protein
MWRGEAVNVGTSALGAPAKLGKRETMYRLAVRDSVMWLITYQDVVSSHSMCGMG